MKPYLNYQHIDFLTGLEYHCCTRERGAGKWYVYREERLGPDPDPIKSRGIQIGSGRSGLSQPTKKKRSVYKSLNSSL